MKYLKTHEGLFDFLKKKDKKDPFSNKDLKSIIEESLIDLSDDGFTIKVDVYLNRLRNGEGNTISSDPEVRINITRIPYESFDNTKKFRVFDVMETLRFALPYLQKEYGLELWQLSYRETEWTKKRNSGTKKLHTHYRLKGIKDMDTFGMNITLMDRKY